MKVLLQGLLLAVLSYVFIVIMFLFQADLYKLANNILRERKMKKKINGYTITLKFSSTEGQAKAIEEVLRVNTIPEIIEGAKLDKYKWRISLFKSIR